MPTSSKQLAANRRNAQSSTGPRTPQGKHTAARNAISHGIFARDVVASQVERLDDFEALREALIHDLHPQGALEQLLVEQIATLSWRQRRVLRAEAGAIDTSLLEATKGSSRQHAHDLRLSLQMIDSLGGSQGFYGAAITHELREQIESSAEGQTLLLTALRAARASLDGEQPLPAPLCRRLTDLLDPHSELTGLLQLPDSSSSAPLSAPHEDLRAALDRHIACAQDRLAALARRQEEDDTRLTARLSLPPDADADKILRYDKMLANALARTLDELHRLQAARRLPDASS